MTEKINVNLWTEINGVKYYIGMGDNGAVLLHDDGDEVVNFESTDVLRSINEMINKFLSLNGGGS